MQDDKALRAILALILACLVVLVIQGFGAGPDGGQGPYRISVMKSRASPWLMRMNTQTGEVEQFMLRGARRWEPLGDAATGLDGLEETDEGVEPDVGAAEAPPPAPAPPAAPDAPPPAEAGGREEVGALVAALEPGNPREIRVWAAGLLGSYLAESPEVSMAALKGALEDPDARVVAAAARSLRLSGRPDVREALRALEDHPAPEVQAALRETGASEREERP